MITTPDGVEVVQRAADAAGLPHPPLLVLDAVADFLDRHRLGSGPLAWRRIGDGQSNVTYLVCRGDEQFVLRRGPRPPLPRSAHNMVREARIQELVAREGIPVPRILAVCEDDAVLGVPFYVMEALDGDVVTDTLPAALDAAPERAAIGEVVVDTLVQLHAVDVGTGELSSFGRPDGYLDRQVATFAGLWEVNSRRHLPLVNEVGQWLRRYRPDSQRAAIVHGDFRLGNLMLRRGAPAQVLAVLDWEMATLGDPLADLGYVTATWSEPGATSTPLHLSPVTGGPGFASTVDLCERYAAASDLDLTPLPWYQTLALWKAAIFCEAMYTRWLDGQRPGDQFAPALETGVPQLLEQAVRHTENG